MSSSNSVRPTALTWILVALGALLLIAAVVYLTQPANALPGFFPGADAANSAKHIKHGIAAAGLGVLLFVGAWMTTGSKKNS
jgi:zinc transporter ZupT